MKHIPVEIRMGIMIVTNVGNPCHTKRITAPAAVRKWMVERMTNKTYEKLQAELSQLFNTEKYKRMKSKDKDVYKQAVLACKSVVSHYTERKDDVEND